MPISRKRKKNGKPVKRKDEGSQIKVDPDKESNVTLQDLINVLAYQEYQKDGAVFADDVQIGVPEKLPITVEDENGEKRQVGTVTLLTGDSDQIAFDITEPSFWNGETNFSIDPPKENDE